jgi:Ser-tRNA(Ala) deacylase AlaX
MVVVKYFCVLIAMSLGYLQAADTTIKSVDTAEEALAVPTASRRFTRKVFWENPYLRSLSTTVAEVDGNKVIFNKTIAYAESGGQESDAATVNGFPVLQAYLDKGTHEISYTLPDNHGFSVGDSVLMEIDWARRNKLMRYHFTCELVLVLVNRYFGKKPDGVELRPEEIDVIGPLKKGAHMSADSARVDFEFPTNISEHLPAIQALYDKIIGGDMPIEKGYLNEAEQIRFWRIPGLAMVPCGGTHVQSTREVGRAALKRERSSKGVERIKIKLVDETPTHPGEVETE